SVIESPFATVRLRRRVTKGAGSRTKGLLMAYKLLDMAQARWRRLDGAHLLPLVRAGIRFVDGVQPGKSARLARRAAGCCASGVAARPPAQPLSPRRCSSRCEFYAPRPVGPALYGGRPSGEVGRRRVRGSQKERW